MAHQDYISRQKNKKNNPYKKGNKPQPKNTGGLPLKTKLIGVLAATGLIIFITLLWSIKDNSTEEQTIQADTSVIKQSAEPSEKQKVRNKATVPVYQDDGFDFMDDLKHKEVEPGKYEVNDSGPYAMQCGSFKKRSQAEELKAQIAFNGISSQVREAKGSNGTWYKVVLGPYERKRLAEKDKHTLKSNNINYCQIWLWR